MAEDEVPCPDFDPHWACAILLVLSLVTMALNSCGRGVYRCTTGLCSSAPMVKGFLSCAPGCAVISFTGGEHGHDRFSEQGAEVQTGPMPRSPPRSSGTRPCHLPSMRSALCVLVSMLMTVGAAEVQALDPAANLSCGILGLTFVGALSFCEQGDRAGFGIPNVWDHGVVICAICAPLTTGTQSRLKKTSPATSKGGTREPAGPKAGNRISRPDGRKDTDADTRPPFRNLATDRAISDVEPCNANDTSSYRAWPSPAPQCSPWSTSDSLRSSVKSTNAARHDASTDCACRSCSPKSIIEAPVGSEPVHVWAEGSGCFARLLALTTRSVDAGTPNHETCNMKETLHIKETFCEKIYKNTTTTTCSRTPTSGPGGTGSLRAGIIIVGELCFADQPDSFDLNVSDTCDHLTGICAQCVAIAISSPSWVKKTSIATTTGGTGEHAGDQAMVADNRTSTPDERMDTEAYLPPPIQSVTTDQDLIIMESCDAINTTSYRAGAASLLSRPTTDSPESSSIDVVSKVVDHWCEAPRKPADCAEDASSDHTFDIGTKGAHVPSQRPSF